MKVIELSKEYEAALQEHNEAIRVFHAVRFEYRNRLVGDAEYLAARRAYDAATGRFDEAFAAEEARVAAQTGGVS